MTRTTRTLAKPKDVVNAAVRIKEFRDRQDLTQADAAELCNTPLRTWQGWENASREPPPCLFILFDYIDRFGEIEDVDDAEDRT